jgi:hypothetical protein
MEAIGRAGAHCQGTQALLLRRGKKGSLGLDAVDETIQQLLCMLLKSGSGTDEVSRQTRVVGLLGSYELSGRDSEALSFSFSSSSPSCG